MIVKKFLASTEEEAVLLAKAELGDNVTIMNTKKIEPHGFSRFFKKTSVEITAAVDDNIREEKKEDIPDFSKLQQAIQQSQPAPDSKAAKKEADIEQLIRAKQVILDDEDESVQKENDRVDIEQRLTNLQDLLEKQLNTKREEEKEEKEKVVDQKQAYLDLIRKQLIDSEVEACYVEQIIEEIEGSLTNNTTLDNILANVYQKIVLKIGTPHLIDLRTKRTKYIFFIGPTGVGKTTTIAKIASTMKLSKKTKVALITSDTYRIAAVEQLKTYANILGVPLKVIYSPEEMEKAKEELSDFDLVLVDTAGRSHNNHEQQEDIGNILRTIPEGEREVFLVLSATTKYRDLVNISKSYSEICKYNLIFTKLDETDTVGNIFNIHILTGAPLSYTTWGQNVPDDIGKIDAQKIAKQLLGGNS
ncbi:MAG: flagellar biosynthesis protein FlhF [Lachnospiraceae bacterium]|nr:flagellar biosynthesis protein FlhF [Lachnospiraceae bacterium]